MNKRQTSVALTCAILLSLNCQGAWAADTATGSGNGVAIGTGSNAPKAENVAIGKGANIKYSNGASKSTGDVAIGNSAVIDNYASQGGSIAIGKNATIENMTGRQESLFALGQTTYHAGNFWGTLQIPDNPENVAGSIAIGDNTYARTGSIMIGSHNYRGQIGDQTVDTSKTKSYDININATTLGTNSFNQGAFSTVNGSYSIISGKYNGGGYSAYGGQNFGATITGSLNSIESATSNSPYSGVANSIVGTANRSYNSNGALIFGAGNEITNSIISISAPSSGGDSAQALQQTLMQAVKDSESGGATLAIGGGNKADYTQKTSIIGVNNTVTGTKDSVSSYNSVTGFKNTLDNVQHVTVTGSNNTVTNTQNALVLGDNRTASGANGSVILGGASSTQGITTQAQNAVVMGTDADVTVDGGVAIGAQSQAVRDKGVKGYDPSTKELSTNDSATWKATGAAVSIGDMAQNLTRQITNVAAGSEDTDAVNVAQLKQVDQKAGKHTKVTVEGGTEAGTTDYAGTNLKLKATTTTDGQTTYDLKLGDDITVGQKGTDGKDGSIGVNGKDGSAVVINGKDGSIGLNGKDGVNGLTIKGENGKVGVDGTDGHDGKDGMTRIVYEDHNKVTHEVATLDDGLKFGGDFGDASAVKLNKQVNVKGNAKNETDLTDGNIGVVSSQDGDNGQLLIKLNKDLDLTDKGSVTIGGITLKQGAVSMGGNQVANVASGTTGKTWDATTQGYEANWNNAANVGDVKTAINDIKGADKGGFGLTADDGQSVKQDLGKTITVTGDTNLETKVNDGKLQIGLKKDVDLGPDGSIKTGDTTINKDGVETNKITIKDSNISIDKDGIDAGNTVIKNVASGTNGKSWDTTVSGQENWNNAANIGDVKKIAGDAADSVKVKSGKNITVKLDNTVNLNDQITLGDETNKAQQVTIDGNKATVTAGDGDNQVKLDGSKGQITAGGATLGKQAGGGANTADGNYLTGLDNKTWDAKNIASGRAATEDQLKAVDDKITGGRVFQGDDGKDNAVTVGLGSTMKLTGGADAANLVNGNIGVVKNSDGDGLEIKLAKDIKGLDSVTTGNTTINNSGVTIKSSDTTKGGDIKIATGDVSMGGSQIHDVAPGTNGTDAVNMNQLSGAMNNVERNLTKLDTRVNRAGANAAALAALHPLDFDPDDKLDVAAGTGHYNGANAVAIGAFYRPNEDTMISLGGSMGGGENMINAGVTFKLGQHNHVSTTRVAMAKEIKALKALVNQQYGEMQQMKQMVNQLAGKTALSVDTSALFPDIPQNHWAYEYVTKLAHTGILEGYPDGEFKGDRMMTRYEFATMLYRAIMSGAASNPDLNKDGTLDKLTKEFEPELKYIRIDVIQKDKDGVPTIERVRTTEAAKYHKAGK